MHELLKAEEIDRAQDQFDRALKDALPSKGAHKLGYRGGGMSIDLYSKGRMSIYYASVFLNRNDTAPRFWNAFGYYDGKSHGQQRIVVEINIPNPANRQVAAFFARDATSGDIFLLHDGKIGGGKVGVTRAAFLEFTQLPTTRVKSGHRHREGIVIGKLSDPSIVLDIEKFVGAVLQFKESLEK